MDELQGSLPASCLLPTAHATFDNPTFYQQSDRYNYPESPPSVSSSYHSTRNTTEINKPDQQRLNALFNQWVPRADEFYDAHKMLNLSDDDITAIKKQIIEYRVHTALAAEKYTTYKALWEQPRRYLMGSRYAPNPTVSDIQQERGAKESGATNFNVDDPLGLGLASAPATKDAVRAGNVMDLLD